MLGFGCVDTVEGVDDGPDLGGIDRLMGMTRHSMQVRLVDCHTVHCCVLICDGAHVRRCVSVRLTSLTTTGTVTGIAP